MTNNKANAGRFKRSGKKLDIETDSRIHKIPSVPLLLDGLRAPPEAVKDFDGQELYYIVVDNDRAMEALPVFSDLEKAKYFIANFSAESPGLSPVSERAATTKSPRSPWTDINPYTSADEIADVIGGGVRLFPDSNYQGREYIFYAGFAGQATGSGSIPDFRKVKCVIFDWFCSNINDMVSSVINESSVWAYVRPYRAWAILHEHINYQGSQLWILQNKKIPDLRSMGWNDRASSLSYRVTL